MIKIFSFIIIRKNFVKKWIEILIFYKYTSFLVVPKQVKKVDVNQSELRKNIKEDIKEENKTS